MPRRSQPRSSPAGATASLDDYRAKRKAGATPEPFGEPPAAPATAGGGIFVVQKHAARRTHYDLRLELDGVLKSWAVPRGPSPDPVEKRLAVATEDHPLEYAGFEGVIPDGNYGAGAMILWDRGTWVPLEDAREGLRKGKLLFELHGYKLRGTWTLFRTRPPLIHRGKSRDEDKQWLLMKKPDAAAHAGEPTWSEASVLSGLTVDELGADEHGSARFHQLRDSLVAAGAKPGAVDPRTLQFMLAQPDNVPFSRQGWIYELKYDGYRLVAARTSGRVFLRYRNGHDATLLYPEIGAALERLPAGDLVLDGEVVVLDAEGRPSFSLLQQRALLSRPLDAQAAAQRTPATLFCFDLLGYGGLDLRPLPLLARKEALRHLLPPAGPLRYCDHVVERGKAFFAEIGRMGLEGMVAKRADSPYVPRRSSDWLKYRCDRNEDLVIVGTSAGKGRRSGFGALHVATCRPGAGDDLDLVYAGRVGTGFSEADLGSLAKRLHELGRETPPCSPPAGGELPRGAGNAWVEPRLVCEVRFKEWTPQGMLRHPVFVRLREDKSPAQCVRQDAAAAGEPRVDDSDLDAVTPPMATAATPAAAASARRGRSKGRGAVMSTPTPGPAPPLSDRAVDAAGSGRPPAPDQSEVVLSNLDKPFWPEDGFDKGDLIDYYRRIAPAMLPYLEDRPLVLTRFPDGIHGKSFFQKNAPDFAPAWLHTETIWSEGSERDIEYFICNDVATLVYLANLATIPIHIWSSRLGTLDRPDWCILDLDPKDAPFENVIEIALEIHALCEQISMPNFVKTSGSSGLHVLLPLGRALDYEQSRSLGLLVAQVVSRRRPEIATIARALRKRDGKVYIDALQNGHGRLIVAPYCLRPLPGAPVSAPLRWSEVKPGLTLDRFNLRSMLPRLRRQKHDPLLGVLEATPDLLGVLDRLSRLV